MDPWLTCQGDVTISGIQATKFEDNFNPISRIFEKLPDSEEYIAILERKLQRIKSNPDVLAQLISKREACMRQLLCEETRHVEEETEDLERPVYNSQVLRTVAPHRQALNQGEVIELIKYRLPLLLMVGFMVLDIRMQLNINIQPRGPWRVPQGVDVDYYDSGDDSWETFDEEEASQSDE